MNILEIFDIIFYNIIIVELVFIYYIYSRILGYIYLNKKIVSLIVLVSLLILIDPIIRTYIYVYGVSPEVKPYLRFFSMYIHFFGFLVILIPLLLMKKEIK